MAATDYDFSSTRNEIIQRAYRIIGVGTDTDSLTANQLTQGVIALNQLVKSLQNKRIYLWTEQGLTQALTATVPSYALSTNPAVYSIEKAFLRISNTDIPLEVISWREYQAIPDKSSAGDPTHCTTDGTSLYVYPVPSQSRTLYYLGLIKAKDWDTSSGSGDFPVRYQDALTYGLAAHLADEYGVPLTERQYLDGKATQLLFDARNFDTNLSDIETVTGAFPNG